MLSSYIIYRLTIDNGPLDFDMRPFKCATPIISEPLAQIINRSLLHGRIHKDGKRARNLPVCKTEEDFDFGGNYRPMSVIGYTARFVQSLMCFPITFTKKVVISYSTTDMRNSNDILLKLAYTE